MTHSYTMAEVEQEENDLHWVGLAYQVTSEGNRKTLLADLEYAYEMRFFPATGQGVFTDAQRQESQEAADKFTAMVHVYIPDWEPPKFDTEQPANSDDEDSEETPAAA